MIDNANKGSAIDSAYGYKDAVEKYYVERLSEDISFKLDGEYVINNGVLNDIEILVSGTKPINGNLLYENNELKSGCLTFDEYKVVVENGKMLSPEKGTCDLPPTSCYLDNSYYSPESWFTFNDDNPSEIIGYTGGNDKKVHIPCFREDGTKITLIGQTAFSGANLSEVVIPDSIFAYQGAFLGANIGDLVLGNFNIPPYIFFGPLDGVNNIYNIKGKNLDWNQVLTGIPSGERFASGTVIRRGTQEVNIISDKVEPDVKHSVVYTDSNGTKYYDSKWVGQNPVYFDPTGNDENCSATNYNNTGKIGCMKWYAYSENNDGTVNMILDHNTTSDIKWISEEDYNKSYDAANGAKNAGITYPSGTTFGSYGSYGNWDKGPITLLNQLKEDTSAWAAVSTRSDIYTNSNNNTGSNTHGGEPQERFTINYSGYKARLITADEIAHLTKNITSKDWSEKISSKDLYFDIDAMWLLNNSYWTASPIAGNSRYAWFVGSGNSSIYSYSLSYGNGLRPVITVSNSVVFGS